MIAGAVQPNDMAPALVPLTPMMSIVACLQAVKKACRRQSNFCVAAARNAALCLGRIVSRA